MVPMLAYFGVRNRLIHATKWQISKHIRICSIWVDFIILCITIFCFCISHCITWCPFGAFVRQTITFEYVRHTEWVTFSPNIPLGSPTGRAHTHNRWQKWLVLKLTVCWNLDIVRHMPTSLLKQWTSSQNCLTMCTASPSSHNKLIFMTMH